MHTFLVTGAAGFIGSHLCERLIDSGQKVIGLDNFDPFYARTIKENNLKTLQSHPSFKLYENDIEDLGAANRILKEHKISFIIHLAAKAGIRPSILAPLEYERVNSFGTNVMLEAANQAGIKNFIFASSSSIYGNNPKVPFSETDSVDRPISPYAATKKAGELLCATYSHLYAMNITCLRFFTVYGPRQRPDLAIHRFVNLIENERPITVFGDGSMARDFTYIEDIIQGIIAAIEHLDGYRIFNLGEAEPVRLDTLISEIETALGKKAKILHQPMQAGDVLTTYADIRQAREHLNYQPRTHLREGLRAFVEWFRKQPKDVTI